MGKKIAQKNTKNHISNPGLTITSKYTYLFIFLSVFVLYGNTIFNKYSLDDHLVAIDNYQIIRGISAIPDIFLSRYSQNEGDFSYGYRPIVLSTFAFEYSLWGTNPYLSHLINILLFALSCLLLYLILKNVFNKYDALFPLLITLVFAAHPIHTEVVASLKNRDELLSLAGAFGAILMMMRYIDTNKWKFVAFGFFLFFFSYMSKATSLPYVVLIPLILYFYSDVRFSRLLLITIGLAGIVLIARFGPKLYLPDAFRPRRFFENNIRYEDFLTRTSTGMYILLFYLKKLFIPYPLSFYYGYNTIPIVKFTDFRVIISIIFHGGIFIYSMINLRKKSILAFIILFYLISIAMYTNILRPAMGIVAERFLLTPSIAFSIFIVFVFFRIFTGNLLIKLTPALRNKIILRLLVFIIPYTALTINRNRDWKDHLTLYSADIGHLENSVKANILYAQKLKDKLKAGEYKPGEKEQLIHLIVKHYKQALKIYPKHDVIWNNLATMYTNFMGMNEEAILYEKEAVKLNPKNLDYAYNLAMLYNKLNQPHKAIFYLEKANKLDTLHDLTLYNLARIYNNIGIYDSANYFNNKLIKTAPKSDLPWINLGNFSLLQSDTLAAINYWEKAVEINPTNVSLTDFLAKYFTLKNNENKANYYKNLTQQYGN